MMKNFFLTSLMSFALIATTSCSNDDGKGETSITGAWKLTSLSINGRDSSSELDECDLQDTYTFMDDGKFSLKSNEKKDSDEGGCTMELIEGSWVADNSVEGSRRFNLSANEGSQEERLTLEGDILRRVVVDAPDEEGLVDTFSYVYTKQ